MKNFHTHLKSLQQNMGKGLPICVLSDDVISDINECASSPCQNGGICSDEIGKFTCTCAGGYTGTTCQSGKMNESHYF